MTDKDYKNFSLFCLQMKELSCDKKELSEEGINFLFGILQDMELNEIRANAILYFRNTHPAFFPDAAILRNERTEEKAILAFETIKRICDDYFVSKEYAIKKINNEHPELAPMADIWVNDIMDERNNITVVRSQFIKSFVAHQHENIKQQGQLPAGTEQKQLGEPAQIGGTINQIMESIKK